jgi:hypothetical protein
MVKVRLDEAELQSRRAFFEIRDDDLRRLASLRAFADKYRHEVVEDLYVLILGHADSAKLFVDHVHVDRTEPPFRSSRRP